MRLKTLAAFGTAISLALPAVAQTAPATTAPPVKEKKICRQYAVTGSIVPTKSVCHTKAEWAQIDDANARNADSMLSGTRAPK